MNRFLLAGLFALAALSAQGEELPAPVSEAVDLELQGRLGEALDRYRAALSTVPALVQDEALALPLTVRVFSKAAHLSIDLGYGEEAWDLSARLLAAKNQKAAEAGTLVRLRLLRMQERWADGLALFDAYASAWPLPPPSLLLLTEVRRIRAGAQKSPAALEVLIRKGGGPASWVLDGSAALLPGPAEVWDLNVQETARLQVGAFRDWANALTLIDMLRENGWVPFTDVKVTAGEKLHIVYVVSRQPASDKARLEAQGLSPP